MQGKHTIADRWEEEPYRAIRQPIPDNPVFDVQREDGTGRIRPLHRNQLLPITSLPIDELHDVEEADRAKGRQTIDIPGPIDTLT